MYVILNVSLRNDAIVHCHDRLRAMWRSPARRNRSVAAQILCPCVPRSKCWVLREGQRAARLVQARPAAHRSRSACCTEVLRCQRRPARVETCSPCCHCSRCVPGVRGAATDRCWSSDAPACWILCTQPSCLSPTARTCPGVSQDAADAEREVGLPPRAAAAAVLFYFARDCRFAPKRSTCIQLSDDML